MEPPLPDMMLISSEAPEEVFLSEAPKRTPRPVTGGGMPRASLCRRRTALCFRGSTAALDEDDLAESTGLPEAQVQASLAKLETLGLIAFEGGPPAQRASSTTAASRASSVHLRAAASARTASPRRRTRAAKLRPEPARRRIRASGDGPATPRPVDTVRRPRRPRPPVARPPDSPRQARRRRRPRQRRAQPAALGPATPEEERRARSRTSTSSPTCASGSSTPTAISTDATTTRCSASRRARTGRSSSAPTSSSRRPFTPTATSASGSGSFKVRMEAVFARLTIAHDTLSDKGQPQRVRRLPLGAADSRRPSRSTSRGAHPGEAGRGERRAARAAPSDPHAAGRRRRRSRPVVVPAGRRRRTAQRPRAAPARRAPGSPHVVADRRPLPSPAPPRTPTPGAPLPAADAMNALKPPLRGADGRGQGDARRASSRPRPRRRWPRATRSRRPTRSASPPNLTEATRSSSARRARRG